MRQLRLVWISVMLTAVILLAALTPGVPARADDPAASPTATPSGTTAVADPDNAASNAAASNPAANNAATETTATGPVTTPPTRKESTIQLISALILLLGVAIMIVRNRKKMGSNAPRPPDDQNWV